MQQSWVIGSYARSETDDNGSAAAYNKRHILGSSIFGENSNSQWNSGTNARNSSMRTTNQSQTYPSASYSTNEIPQRSPPITSFSTTQSLGSNYIQTVPDFSPIEYPQPPPEIFDNQVFTRSPPHQYGRRRLEVQPSPDMRKLREELVADSSQFSQRLRRLAND